MRSLVPLEPSKTYSMPDLSMIALLVLRVATVQTMRLSNLQSTTVKRAIIALLAHQWSSLSICLRIKMQPTGTAKLERIAQTMILLRDLPASLLPIRSLVLLGLSRIRQPPLLLLLARRAQKVRFALPLG